MVKRVETFQGIFTGFVVIPELQKTAGLVDMMTHLLRRK